MQTTTGLLGELTPEQRERVRSLGSEVRFDAGERIFEEGSRADRFWILHTGSATLAMHIPGHRDVAIDHVRHGELLGWSWMFQPYVWSLAAQADSPVRALEFDALTVRVLCDEDKALGLAMTRSVAAVMADRLQRCRARLVDLFGPYAPHDAATDPI
ncbi:MULTISPECIES: cyclic nucleotide-binding domain-containing protein [unclassified Streptomyces]|uniref:Crp/Fnr family transcriptional regulator n=1 Tax=unclassified Streptomyces TaxID=2593676 RepID=UPI0023EC8BD1|nr:cyclic nucleotide-binding domain-containing protein [Streptomyces sp. WMMB303]MDF4254226.1 cyclic nucleotide-binding domain-containing protein [Streptomyces sp. WMMB303]